jgi:hypothetical protein
MTDAEIKALVERLRYGADNQGRGVTAEVMTQAASVVTKLLEARTAYRKCHGGHTDDCNAYMGWRDTKCDCPHTKLKAALIGGPK